MLTPSTPIATPFPIESTNTVKTATVEANARAAVQAQQRAGAANEAHVADVAAAQTTAQRAATAIPDPMASLSTVAVAGAMHTVPAALGMLQRLALASASGTLTDADRQNLQSVHAQLTAKIVGSVGSVGAGEQAQTSTSHDNAHEGNGDDAPRQEAGHHRPALAHAAGTAANQRAERPAQALPADTGSEGPAVQTPAPSPPPPEHAGHPETPHASAAQAAQVSQFVQVAHTGPSAPPVAVA